MFVSSQFSQTFEPKQGFVSLFLGISKIADEIRFGFGPLSRAIIRRSGCSGTNQLPPDDLKLVTRRQSSTVTDDIQRELLGASLKVLHERTRSGSHLSLLTSHFTVLTSGAKP